MQEVFLFGLKDQAWNFEHQVATSDLSRSDDIKHAGFDKDGDADLLVGDSLSLLWGEKIY